MRDPEDKAAFAKEMQGLCAVRLVQPTKALLHGYWVVLNCLSLEEFKATIVKALESEGTWMPSPGDLKLMARPRRVPYHEPWIAPKFEYPSLSPPGWQQFLEERFLEKLEPEEARGIARRRR